VALSCTPAAGADADAPVIAAEVPAGHGSAVAAARCADHRRLDGSPGDWRGRATGFGGSTVYSCGELVYQDHLFDAYGPDDGKDKQRLAVQDPLQATVPEIYRLDPAIQYVPGEFGIPTPGYDLSTHYGDMEHQDEADLSELRVGANSRNLWLLARTTTMSSAPKTAVLLLLDTAPGAAARTVPFGSGITTKRAERAVLLTAAGGWVANLATGAVSPLPRGSVAADADGYVNALEARVPRSALGSLPASFSVAAATGIADPSGKPRLKDFGLGANLANVAFRPNEPARDWWDKQQAFSLEDGSVDPFFRTVDLRGLLHARSETYRPGSGYHDRIFLSSHVISKEEGQEGILQHYGIYLPTAYRPNRRWPLQWWFHFRGGNAHIAAAAVPRIFKDMGEDLDTMVVSPRGRGESTWYVGRGQVDFQEVWRDVHRTFPVDPDRNYIAGHSMGGWATYLMTILYPDRFAAGFPASGPVTQGAWTGVDFDGCDELEADGETPCYTGANGGDPRAEFTRPLLDNLRWVPQAIYQGVADELVPVTGVVRQADRLRELGYRYRLYLFPAQEHYGPPITDQWTDGARYEHRFVRDPNPPRVTYIRSMRFERAVERVQSDGAKLSFDFERAYWMSDLDPTDLVNGIVTFDGHSFGLPARGHTKVPEAGGPATPDQTGPYAMTGQAWKPGATALPEWRNAFTVKLTGAGEVRLDTKRMGLVPSERLDGDVTTQAALKLTLAGRFGKHATVTVDGRPATVLRRTRRAIAVAVPAGHHVVVVRPGSPGRVRQLAVAAVALALLAGCGDDDDKSDSKPSSATRAGSAPAAPPKANGTLEAAGRDLQKAVASGDCEALAARLLPSSVRGRDVAPTDPPTPEECDRLKLVARDVLAGYRFRKAKEFGPAGITEGSGSKARRGEVVANAWELDHDGTWKSDVMGFFEPQIGTEPKLSTNFEASVRKFALAGRNGDCETFWELLHPASPLVVARKGDMVKFCNDVADSYRDRGSALHDMAGDESAEPELLGQTLDMGFYGLRLKSGRYMVFVLWTELSGEVPYSRGHDYPAVIDYLTLTKPGGQTG
jgi:Prolyl oligopeptidase family